MSGEYTDGITQSTLLGEQAERVDCEYYEVCGNPALFIDEILHYGEGKKPVRMCESCAEEHTEVDDNEVQRLKPEDRYVYAEESKPTVWVVSSRKDGSPHPVVEAVYDNQEAAREHKNELAENSFKHDVVTRSVHKRTLHTDTE